MAMFAAFPPPNMEAAFGRLHNSGAGAFGAGSTVVESILVDGKAANIAIQPTPTPTEGRFLDPARKRGFSRGDPNFQAPESAYL